MYHMKYLIVFAVTQASALHFLRRALAPPYVIFFLTPAVNEIHMRVKSTLKLLNAATLKPCKMASILYSIAYLTFTYLPASQSVTVLSLGETNMEIVLSDFENQSNDSHIVLNGEFSTLFLAVYTHAITFKVELYCYKIETWQP